MRESLRKTCLCILVLLVFTCPLTFASPSLIHSLDSSLYRDIADLYIHSGLALPSTSAPYSNEQARFLLSRIDVNALQPVERELYDTIQTELEMQRSPFAASLGTTVETYIHTNTTSFTTKEDWVYSFRQRKPFLSLPIEISLSPFSAHMDISIVQRPYDKVDGTIPESSDLYGIKPITTNLPYQWGGDTIYIDSNVPNRAYLAVGGSNWFLQIGKDRLSWGPGNTGNFMIGEQLQYHNFARITAYRDTFSYTFLTSFFPHPDEVWGNSDMETGQARPILGLKMFMGYRLEWRLLNQRLQISMNESIMYQHEDGILDLRVFNPLTIYHNYYTRSNANSLASLELDYALAKGWNLYAQIAIDELAFGATEKNLIEGRHPDGRALQLGLRMSKPYREGLLSGYLEGVYTDPYLYHRSIDGDADQISNADSLNFIVPIRRWLPDKVIYDHEYLGYRYGGDTIALGLFLGYRIPNDWYVDFSSLLMAQGSIGKYSWWELDELDLAPSGQVTFSAYAGFGLGKEIGPWNFNTSLHYLLRSKCSVTEHDIQLMLGVSYLLR